MARPSKLQTKLFDTVRSVTKASAVPKIPVEGLESSRSPDQGGTFYDNNCLKKGEPKHRAQMGKSPLGRVELMLQVSQREKSQSVQGDAGLSGRFAKIRTLSGGK